MLYNKPEFIHFLLFHYLIVMIGTQAAIASPGTSLCADPTQLLATAFITISRWVKLNSTL